MKRREPEALSEDELCTLQEHRAKGSTSEIEKVLKVLFPESLKSMRNKLIYTPEILLRSNEFSSEEINDERARRRYIGLGIVSHAYGRPDLVMVLQPLDLKKRQTLHDPVFGVWDEEQQRIASIVDGKDYNEMVYRRNRETDNNLFQRVFSRKEADLSIHSARK